ncbi:hypothetical protein ACFVWG_02845 [Kribbella sp. NPDC058245]|uniref:hypothetical protein n=1 Tax=Kribbella sp. NPDC058245 TaxID=3346399 RepID=UPI0036E63C81
MTGPASALLSQLELARTAARLDGPSKEELEKAVADLLAVADLAVPVLTTPADEVDFWFVRAVAVAGLAGCEVCITRVSAGVATITAVRRVGSETIYSAALGHGTYADDEWLRFDYGVSIGYDLVFDAPGGGATALSGSGYDLRPCATPVTGLFEVLHGRAAGFVGGPVDPAMAMAMALLLTEALGQVGGRGGHAPGADTSFLVAGAHAVHYERLSRCIDREGVL